MSEAQYSIKYVHDAYLRKLRVYDGLNNGYANTIEELTEALRVTVSLNDVASLAARGDGEVGCEWAALFPIVKTAGGTTQIIGHSIMFFIPSDTRLRKLSRHRSILGSLELALLFNHDDYSTCSHYTMFHDGADTNITRLLVKTEALKLASSLPKKGSVASSGGIFRGIYCHDNIGYLPIEPPDELIEAAFDNLRKTETNTDEVAGMITKWFCGIKFSKNVK